MKTSRIIKGILKKIIEVGGITLLNIKAYHRAKLVTIVWYLLTDKNGITDHKKVTQNRLAKGHLTYDKNEIKKKRKSFSTLCWIPLFKREKFYLDSLFM